LCSPDAGRYQDTKMAAVKNGLFHGCAIETRQADASCDANDQLRTLNMRVLTSPGSLPCRNRKYPVNYERNSCLPLENRQNTVRISKDRELDESHI
jgi:hypothetical protein